MVHMIAQEALRRGLFAHQAAQRKGRPAWLRAARFHK
jgi:hypothetical protein